MFEQYIVYYSLTLSPHHTNHHSLNPPLECETHTLDSLTRAPWQAYPDALLYNTKQLHLPHQFKSLRLTSLAARTRTALATAHH